MAKIFYTSDIILTEHILKFMTLTKIFSRGLFSVNMNSFSCLKLHVWNHINDFQDVILCSTFPVVYEAAKKIRSLFWEAVK